jgi:hypothetical protein
VILSEKRVFGHNGGYEIKVTLELSSLRSQLEYWNVGILEYWVLAKWVIGSLAKPLLTGKSTNDILPLKTNIPTFQHSIIPARGKNPSLKKGLYIQ